MGLAAIMRNPTDLTASISVAAGAENVRRFCDITCLSKTAVSLAVSKDPSTCLKCLDEHSYNTILLSITVLACFRKEHASKKSEIQRKKFHNVSKSLRKEDNESK